MAIEINTIITLSNDKKYKIISEIMYLGKKYFLALEESVNNELIFEEEIDGLDTYVKKVIDSKLYQKLMKKLKK